MHGVCPMHRARDQGLGHAQVELAGHERDDVRGARSHRRAMLPHQLAVRRHQGPPLGAQLAPRCRYGLAIDLQGLRERTLMQCCVHSMTSSGGDQHSCTGGM